MLSIKSAIRGFSIFMVLLVFFSQYTLFMSNAINKDMASEEFDLLRAGKCTICGSTNYYVFAQEFLHTPSACYYQQIRCRDCNSQDLWIFPHTWYEDYGKLRCAYCGYSPYKGAVEKENELFSWLDRKYNYKLSKNELLVKLVEYMLYVQDFEFQYSNPHERDEKFNEIFNEIMRLEDIGRQFAAWNSN